MCLITKQLHPKIADNDIICYKVLLKTKTGERTSYVSPIQHWFYFKDEPDPNYVFVPDKSYWLLEKNEDIKPSYVDNLGIVNPYPVNYELYSGYFHMYKNKEDAEKFMTVYRVLSLSIFECVIPKGSKYYEGTCQMQNLIADSIASDKLIVKKQLC